MPELLGFTVLAGRLIRHVRERVRRGELTEAALALLLGYSQPHIHNVLKGKRGLSFALADDLLDFLNMPLVTFLSQHEQSSQPPAPDIQTMSATFLSGYLGAGTPYPVLADSRHRITLDMPRISSVINPLAHRISPNETSMWPIIQPRDTVVIDSSPNQRRRPDPNGIYTLCWKNRGYLGRCRRRGERLDISVENPSAATKPPSRVSLAGGERVLDVVRGKVIWLSRQIGPQTAAAFSVDGELQDR